MTDITPIATVIVAVIVVAATLLTTWLCSRADRDRIRAEAERQQCRVVSIVRSWFPLYNKTFDWLERSNCRLYCVICRDEQRHRRRAYVLIGPRHSGDELIDVYGDLTWRWERPNY